jgi:hypothetical protein
MRNLEINIDPFQFLIHFISFPVMSPLQRQVLLCYSVMGFSITGSIIIRGTVNRLSQYYSLQFVKFEVASIIAAPYQDKYRGIWLAYS